MTITPERQKELEAKISKILNPNDKYKRIESDVDKMLREETYVPSGAKYSKRATHWLKDYGGMF